MGNVLSRSIFLNARAQLRHLFDQTLALATDTQAAKEAFERHTVVCTRRTRKLEHLKASRELNRGRVDNIHLQVCGF